MASPSLTPDQFEELIYGSRYYTETAKNSIESVGHVAAEAGSNEDEAITRRAERDGTLDRGRIDIAYDTGSMEMTITGDGDGMLTERMHERLKYVGEEPQENSRRGYFHRGIREVFLAMGGGQVESIGRTDEGDELLSHAVFDPRHGMAMALEDIEPSEEQRQDLGLASTGTRVRIPMQRFAKPKPRLFTFGQLEWQIRDCVGIRPVLTDPDREVYLHYDNEPPRRLQFEYPESETLVSEREVEIGAQKGTFWAKLAEKPLKGGTGKQMRRSGILIRGERAAYEVSVGEKLSAHPAIGRVFGELRLDGIEELQRAADDEAQLVYKPDRSGLNPEHALVEAIYKFLDDTLAPLIENLEAGDERRKVTPDMRRQLAKLARVINQVIKEDHISGIDTPDGSIDEQHEPREPAQDPPDPPEERERFVADGVGFAYDRIFVEAGKSRTVEVWFDSDLIDEGAEVVLRSERDNLIHAASLSADQVPAPGADGIAELDLTLLAGNSEGRHEVTVFCQGFSAILPVHVRFPRSSGFISNIVPKDEDWASGSAIWNPSTGVVTVYEGRPEFKAAAARAKRDGVTPWEHPLYRQLVVESVREAALWPAAELKAQVEWDELPFEERQDGSGFHGRVRAEFQELDYALREKLLRSFVEQ